MEIEKKVKKYSILIILFSLIVFISYNQFLKEKNGFFINNYNGVSDVKKLHSKEVIYLKNNIYKYKNKLHIGSIYKEFHFLTKENLKKGVFLHDSIDNKSISKLIDIESYEEVLENILYKDKNNTYFLSTQCYISCLKLLETNPKTLKILGNIIDNNSEYLSDGNKIYCLRNGEEIKTTYPKTFHVIEINGSSFGIDSTSVYHMCEPMSPNDFRKYMDHIPIIVRDSIVRTYFSETIIE